MDFLAPDKLLLVSLCLPLAGAVLICLLCGRHARRARWIALGTTLLTLLAVARLVFQFQTAVEPQFALFNMSWLGVSTGIDARLSLGLDGLSVWFFGLSALLTLSCVLISWEAIDTQVSLFYCLLLVLLCGMMGVFVARDLLLFYIFFEFTLVPLFFLIGIWGHEERNFAATKFFLFTLAGSLLSLSGLLTVVLYHFRQAGEITFSIPRLTEVLNSQPMSLQLQCWVFAALFAGFAVKVPLVPLHTWLPLAHTQAPAAGSVLLAGVLLKLGTYGFVRFVMPFAPEATACFLPALLFLCVVGIVYGALVALAQSDMKRLIAYSSVSHLGFCMLGLFALTPLAVQGGVLQAINHGISTGGLFAIVGMIYDRYHTREIRALGGLARRTPWLAFFMVLFTLSSIGMPGLNGFAGEFLLLCGTFQRAWMTTGLHGTLFKVLSVLSVSGVVLGAWYMLWLVQRVFFGPLREPDVHGDGANQGSQHGQFVGGTVRDLKLREIAALAPLAVFVFWIGLCPRYFLSRMGPALESITHSTTVAWERLETTPPEAHVAQTHPARKPAGEVLKEKSNSPRLASNATARPEEPLSPPRPATAARLEVARNFHSP